MIFPSSLGIVLAGVVATVFGYVLTASTLPLQFRRSLAWVLAPGIGLGFCSLVFFAFRRPMFTVEFVLLLTICALWFRRKSWRSIAPSIDLSWRPSLISLVFAIGLGSAITGLFIGVARMPYGDWDGWNIWNSHARLLHRAGSNWTNLLPYTFHGDYPLLTSAVAARFWRYAGREVPEAGAILGILLSLSGIAVLGWTLKELRDVSLAALFSFVLLGTPNYLDLASDQFADVPLSFFILVTIALIVIYLERATDSRSLVLAGFTAGCAAWTKNEGLLFLLATSVVLFAALTLLRMKLYAHFVPFVAGAAFPVLVILFFKLAVAPQNDLIANSTHATLLGILNPERHIAILKYAGNLFLSFGKWTISPMIPLFAFVALRGGDRSMLRSSGWLTGFAILAIMTLGYYCVYLTTPHDLSYHLKTSFDRLMIQLWPSFLLLLGLATSPL